MNKLFKLTLKQFGKLVQKQDDPILHQDLQMYLPDDLAKAMVSALGGHHNILEHNHCSTRFRIKVADESKVSPSRLKNQAGATAIVQNGQQFQIVYGQNLLPKITQAFDSYLQVKTQQVIEEWISLPSPLTGTIKDIKDTGDSIFASEALGRGIAIIPTSNQIIAPCQAKVTAMFPTGHAFVISLENGIELFIHIGINTAKIKAKQGIFTIHCQDGQILETGQTIVSFDKEKLHAIGLESDVVIVVANSFNYIDIQMTVAESVQVGDTLMTLAK